MAANPGSISSQPAAAALTGAEVLPLDQAVGSPVAATALTIGTGYRIVSLGNTNWAAAGAGATPAVGTVFSCTAVGTGTGTAQQIDTRRATAQEIAARALQDPTAAPIFAGLTVSGTATAAQVDADLLTGPVSEHCRNVSGVPLAALTPLYVTGSQGDTTTLEVVPARGDTPGRMPAAGMALAALGTSGSAANGHLVATGPIPAVNTAGLTSGAPLYVAPTGGTTATMPATGLVQVVAVVGRVHANTGTVIVLPGPALPRAAFTGAYGDLSGRPEEISQAEAEAGSETAFRLWSATRWRQAVAAWWGSITGATGRSLAAAATAADARSTIGAEQSGAASSAITAHLLAASHHAPATLAANLETVLSLTGQELAAVSPGAGLTRLLWWNPATSRLEFLIPGTGLSITSGQLNAAGGSPGGSSGQLQWNLNGGFSGLSTSSIDGSGNITLSGRFTSSQNSAASAPAIQTTGTWFSGGTGTTTQPHVLIQHSAATTNTAWATTGTGLAIYGSIINQRLIDAGANGSSFFRLYGNVIEIGPTGFQGWWVDNQTLAMRNANILGWSSANATSPTLDTFWTRFSAGVIYQQGGTTAQSYWIANTITSSGTNFERMRIGWESNVFTLRTEAGGTGTARGIRIGSSSTQLLGFWGATPVTRPAAIPDATDLATAITAVNALLAAARSAGLIAT